MPHSEFKENALGHLIPKSQVKTIDLLRDELVAQIVTDALLEQTRLANFKAKTMNAINDFVDLSAEEHGVKWGGTKGNISLMSYNGKYRVQRAIGEHRVFDERIQAAKAQIDSCIEEWSQGSVDEIKALINHAFRVNKQGHIDVNQVLSLRQLNIDDPRWVEAMEAIADSIQVTGSSTYLRLYERQSNGKYQQISLDIGKL